MSFILRLELSSPGNQILMGNNQLFNVIATAHAILMIFFLVMPASVGFFGNLTDNQEGIILRDNIISIDKKEKEINYKSEINTTESLLNAPSDKFNNKKLGSYLAGLIEGDGTISVHDSISKNRYSPMFIIVFKIEDKPLAEYLCNLLEIGKVYDKTKHGKHCIWQINKIEDVYILINLINGYFRTPKYEALIRAIEWINEYILDESYKDHYIKHINNPLIKNNYLKKEEILSKIKTINRLDIDITPLEANSWLAGFTDADGKFAISLSLQSKKHKPRVNLAYRLEIRQNYHRDNKYDISLSYYSVMIKIASLFNSNLYSRERNEKLKNQENYKTYYSFIVSINSVINLLLVNDYFNKNPLLSSKYLDFKDWSTLLLLINDNNKSSSNINCVNLGIKLRKDFNKTRHTYNWDHLKNNYYIKN